MTQAQITKAVRKQFAEVYYVAGVGWCGPRWMDAQELEARLKGGR